MTRGSLVLRIARESARYIGGEQAAPWEVAAADQHGAHVFDALPPRGRRHLVLTVEKEDSGVHYSIMVSGNTWLYWERFERAALPGGYIGDTGGGREYVRLLQHLQDDEEGSLRVHDVLGDGVLNGHAVFFVDETDASGDAFVAWLRTVGSVHFR